MQSVFFATPCYRSDPQAAIEWASRIATELRMVDAKVSVETMCPWIDLARETLVTNFLTSTCELLFFRDDDIDIDATVLQRMITANKSIVVAPYYKRARRENGPGVWATDALGCALIHRIVIDRLYGAYSELHYFVEGRRHVGLFDSIYDRSADGTITKRREDGAFLYRARDQSFEVHQLDDVTVTHAGIVSYFKKEVAEDKAAE